MATITLRYNGRNKVAKSIVKMIEESGLFDFVSDKNERNDDVLKKAIEDIRNGKGVRCRTFEEYKRSVKEI